jgi:hypothetical protein
MSLDQTGGDVTVRTMRLLVSLTLVLLLVATPAVAQVVLTPELNLRTAPDAVDVSALFSQRYPRTLALLEAEFPDDHANLMAELSEIDRQVGEESRLLLAAFERLRELRRKYADRLQFAPSFNHAVMLGLIADFHDLVFAGDGPQVCGRFAHDGSGVLFELGLSARYAQALDLQSVAFFEAVVRAIETPEFAEPVEPEDWNMVFAAMVIAGAPPDYVAAVARGDRNDPTLCPALAAMFRSSGLLDSPAGVRTRADFARNLTGY